MTADNFVYEAQEAQLKCEYFSSVVLARVGFSHPSPPSESGMEPPLI